MPQRLAAKITGVTGYLPPKVLTNADLEKMVETNDEWIRDRTGIRERRILEQGVAASDLATEAAKQLLAQRNVRAEEIDLIVVATVTPDMLFPATACLVQDRIGAKHAWGFDLSAACSGFVYGLTVGAEFVGAGTHKKALVLVLDFLCDVDGSGGCYLYMPGGGSLHPPSHETVDKRMHYVHQEGQQVFKYAVRRMAEVACTLLGRNGYSS